MMGEMATTALFTRIGRFCGAGNIRVHQLVNAIPRVELAGAVVPR